VLEPYRQLFAVPGAARLVAAGFVARMPISMQGIGIVLLVSDRTGSYGLAGAVVATFVIAGAVVGPLLARAVDRVGQRRVVAPAVGVHVVAFAALLACVEAGAPRWTYFVTGAVAGGAIVSIGSLVRARWSHLIASGPQLHTAFSLESVLDELIFILGPVLVTVLTTEVDDLAGLLVAVVLTVGGTTALLADRGSEPPTHAHRGDAPGSAIRVPGVLALAIVFVTLGATFGSLDVVVIAFTEEEGVRSAAGPVLAVFAVGSMLSGIVVGAAHPRWPLERRLLAGFAALSVAVVPLLFVGSIGSLVPAALIAGMTISPILITGFALVESLVAPGQLTEGLTWTLTGLGVGFAAGSSIAGRVVDAAGAEDAFAVIVLCCLAGGLAAAAGLRRLRTPAAA
jgi:MFS family permease